MRITAVAATLLALLLGTVSAPAGVAAERRLHKGYAWGRCLLKVANKTLIAGRCSYEIHKGGAFSFHGPRQVWDGIDYENPGGGGAGQRSADYWVAVNLDEDGTWYGYSVYDVSSTHGTMHFETLTRDGACYLGKTATGWTETGWTAPGAPVRICLWRE